MKMIAKVMLMTTWLLSGHHTLADTETTKPDGTDGVPDSSEVDTSNDWDKIEVPGARCGNGETYKIFMRKGDPQKLAFGFSGGGACWSSSTCFGPVPRTSLAPTERMTEKQGIYSTDKKLSSLAEHTHIYFPYCTGDVHGGTHTAQYGARKREVFHVGYLNIQKSLEHLKKSGLIKFENISDATLYGLSAGAIGAMFHVPTIDAYLPVGISKSVIADSPGMHFGNKFWSKFPPEQMADYQNRFTAIGMPLDVTNGNIAKDILNYCGKFSAWEVAILQSTQDVVMSLVFGDISAAEHEKLVLGPLGIFQQTIDPKDNCRAWVPANSKHTFIQTNSDFKKTAGNKPANEFINETVDHMAGANYKD